MANYSNASTFRAYARVEEQMIRAAMPRTSEADPTPLRRLAEGAMGAAATIVAARPGSRLVRPLTATLKEVANA